MNDACFPNVNEYLAMTPVRIDYTNHRGERSVRRIRPISRGDAGIVRFGSDEWHPEPQWLLEAQDLERDGVIRTFAMQDIHSWQPDPTPLESEDAHGQG